MLTPETTKQLVDERLEQEFHELTGIARGIGSEYVELIEVIQRLSERGGKRLRPHLSMLVYEAYSGLPGSDILSVAVSQELLHLAMLIHDDIMDQDLIRYGSKNVSGVYRDVYATDLSDERLVHEADTMAILAGDLLQARGYRLASSVDATPDTKTRIEQLIADTMTRVIGGQLLDIQAPFRKASSIDPLVIAKHKTASYSFETPMLIGGIMAEVSEPELKLLSELAQKVGIGYQLMDDLLGVFGDEATTGKSVDGDIREGKQTLLVRQFDSLATPTQSENFYQIFGRTNSKEDIAKARKLLIDSGAREKVEAELAKIVRSAEKIVEKLAIKNSYKTSLKSLVSKGLARQK